LERGRDQLERAAGLSRRGARSAAIRGRIQPGAALIVPGHDFIKSIYKWRSRRYTSTPADASTAMLTGTNLVYTKQYNLRIVHEVVRRFGPLSRADIAQRTELTVQTISNLVKELVVLGLVFETDRRRQKRGAPSSVIGVNPEGAFTLGLDLDRDHLTGVLVDLAGRVRQRKHVDLDFPTPIQALDLMVETAELLMAAEGLTPEEVSGVGVGVPGPMHRAEGGDVRTPDDLGRLLSEGHPTVLEWLDDAADHLTGLVLAVEYVIDPEAIFFGGRLPERMIAGLMERVAAHLPKRRIQEKLAGP